MKKSNYIYIIIFLILIGIIFKNWFLSTYIVGGDWPFFFQEYVNHFTFLPPAWYPVLGNGFAGQSVIYTTDSYLYFTGWLFSVIFHIPWPWVYKICWFGMFLLLSTWSSIFLFKTIFPKSFLWQRLLASFLYITNTYILLVAGGGQMGSVLAYAIAPFVMARAINLREFLFIKGKRYAIANTILLGFLLSVQILFDFRFAYITMGGVLLYLLVRFPYKLKQIAFILLYILLIPVSISILLHAYWLLPLIVFRQNPVASLGAAYTSVASLQFFSFATFSNSISLLHPYWPDNIFGFVSFMNPEYLLIPVVAFSALFFIGTKKVKYTENRAILFFSLLGLFGAFLAKGSNDPFGQVYIWAFEHVPGFIMFRDPTKWYLLIALSYSLLIPFTLYSAYKVINSRFKTQNSKLQIKILRIFPNLLLLLFVLVWLFTIKQALLGDLNGTFANHVVPEEYIQLKNMLIRDPQFSRTLWIPNLQRFGYYDQTHPAIVGEEFYNVTSSSAIIKQLQQKNAEQNLSNDSVKYIIVPIDSEQEIFLKDRKYYAQERNQLVAQLQKISWLRRDPSFKELAVFAIKGNNKERFWMIGNREITSHMLSDSKYLLTVSPGPAAKLIFNESYSPYWEATYNGSSIEHYKFGLFNEYKIPTSGNKLNIILRYLPLTYFQIGRIISLITIIAVICLLFMSK